MISRRTIWFVSAIALAAGGVALLSAPQELKPEKQAALQSSSGNPGLSSLPDSPDNGGVPATASTPANGAASQKLSGSINPLWAIPVNSLSAIHDRPVFSPSRHPPAPASPPPVPAQPVPVVNEPVRPALVLVGAVASEARSIAIFREEATNNIVRLKMGEAHSGWILRSVEGREATLQGAGQTAVLEIPNP